MDAFKELFDAWVANTILEISGICDKHSCGLPSKCALTSAETGAAACQAVSFHMNQALSGDLRFFGETSATLH